jgi:predicted pyridoxine 5'-phosphate oxidase superfamily flavin-nucleotide-binding protein
MAIKMAHRFSQLTFTPSVVRMQEQFGTAIRAREVSQRMPEFDRFSQREVEFIQARDSFYMASVSEDGWPYIQHRGGDVGFLKVVDETSLVFLNYTGNGQYQSMGNLTADNRVALFLMSYPQKRRLKILGRAELFCLENLPQELDSLSSIIASKERVESVIQIHLEAFDWNCPQYITPRYSEAELAEHRGTP